MTPRGRRPLRSWKLSLLAVASAVSIWTPAAVPVTALQSEPPTLTDKPSGSWKRLRSQHFVAVGDATEDEIADALKELEIFRFAISGLVPNARFSVPPPTMVVFKGDNTFYDYKPRGSDGRVQTSVGGYYVNVPEGPVMVLAVHPTMRVERFGVVLHEYAHDFIRLNLPNPPPWLSEGLAEFYSSIAGTAGDSGQVKGTAKNTRALGRPLTSRLPALAFLLTVEDVLRPERARRALNGKQVLRFYAQSWALVHYLIIGRPDRKPGQFSAYVTALRNGRDPVQSFLEIFETSFDQLQKDLQQYVRRQTWQALPLNVPPELERRPETKAEPLLESEVETLQGRLLLQMGQTEEAEKRLTRALARNPSLPVARFAMARLRMANHDHADVVRLLEPVVAAAPNNFAGQVLLGQALIRSTRLEDAAAAYKRATELKPAEPTGWYGISVSAATLGNAAESRAAMDKLQQLSPSSSWYFLRARDFWAAGRDADVVSDVTTYAEESEDNESAYALFIGALSARRLKRSADADAFLASAEKAAGDNKWTQTVLEFLKGRTPANQFLSKAKSAGEQTEAHTYIGVVANLSGQRGDALEHLRWVKERGARTYIEYDLAVSELARLEGK